MLYIYTVLSAAMKVRVYLLRQHGFRLPREDVRASKPMAGYLRVSREPGGRVGHWQRGAALYADPQGVEPLRQLHAIELQAWDWRGAVLAGYESFWDRKRQTNFRQGWFVVFSEGPPAPGPHVPVRPTLKEPA